MVFIVWNYNTIKKLLTSSITKGQCLASQIFLQVSKLGFLSEYMIDMKMEQMGQNGENGSEWGNLVKVVKWVTIVTIDEHDENGENGES